MTESDKRLVADHVKECLETACPLLGRHPETADEFLRSLRFALKLARVECSNLADGLPMPGERRQRLDAARRRVRDLQRILVDPALPAFLVALEDELIFGPRFQPRVDVRRFLK